MNKTELKEIWKNEENEAHIHGWDFHIYVEDVNKWIYHGIINSL